MFELFRKMLNERTTLITQDLFSILGFQPRVKTAMLGVNKIKFFLEEFKWK